MPRKKKVENLPGFEKDTVMQSVINTNGDAYANRKEQKRKLLQKDAELEQMRADIEELKKIIKKLGSK
tara:strand:+ start:2271 stop:2474 length:204 start_codon:yes stop_codon:yes gene_type:complete